MLVKFKGQSRTIWINPKMVIALTGKGPDETRVWVSDDPEEGSWVVSGKIDDVAEVINEALADALR